jgi:hypothetical protein
MLDVQQKYNVYFIILIVETRLNSMELWNVNKVDTFCEESLTK